MRKIITNEGPIVQAEFQFELFDTDQTVYEVLRIMDGIPLFVEDHFYRLQKSLKSNGLGINLTLYDFNAKVDELVRLNSCMEGNIKFVYQEINSESKWAIFFIPHYYPSEQEYLIGVSTNLLKVERINPNSKIIQRSVREMADHLIADQKLYEVLLVDRNGQITEGSRSNVFFVKDGVFHTAPSSKVLVGITRQKVFQCLKDLGFEIIEKCVSTKEISGYDAAFLTGTSPKILPMQSIGNQKYDAQLFCVKRLMECYDQRIIQYIRSWKNSGIKK
jgi:branched-chain amino acid aminotransferase